MQKTDLLNAKWVDDSTENLSTTTDGLHNYDECERKVEILIGVSKGLEKRKLQRKIVKISISNTNVSCGQIRR